MLLKIAIIIRLKKKKNREIRMQDIIICIITIIGVTIKRRGRRRCKKGELY